MKLKKIASLALAGVMAVSMLAGCNTASNDGNPGEGEGEGTTTAGYSAMLGEAVSDAVKDLDYVTFQDNAEDAAALRKALNNIGENSLAVIAGVGTPSSSSDWTNADCGVMRQVFADELGLRDPDLAVDDMSLAFPVNNPDDLNRGMKEGVIFGVDGTVILSEAMDQIAARLNNFFAALPETGSAQNGHVSFDYDYVVSVSVVNKAVSTIDWSSASANFIAVTVTRTVTAD